MQHAQRENWRSLMFVPAGAPQRWAKAHTRGADCLVVDLEDSTQPEHKAAARPQAAEAVRTLTANGARAAVRVNNDPALFSDDLAAVVSADLAAILLPKCERAEELAALDARLDGLETHRGLPRGSTRVIAVIESPGALERLAAIAEGPRLIGLCLGSEDFALSVGRPPTPACLDLACQMIAYAAQARGLMGLAMAIGIGDFSDLDTWSREARRAHAMGLTGALAIHPNQIAPLNEAFGASAAEITEAEAILAAWETRAGGVVSHKGRMLDQPIVERARRLLATARR